MTLIKSFKPTNKTSSYNLNLFSSLLFLFFIQQITFFVESIYALSLLHTSMDGKVISLVLLPIPILFLFIKHSKFNYIIVITLMFLCMFLSPILTDFPRILSSGLGAGMFFLYFPFQLSDKNFPQSNWGESSAMAVLALIAFHSLGQSLDISISGNSKFISWLLIIVAIFLFVKIMKDYPKHPEVEPTEEVAIKDSEIWLSVLGLTGSILFIYFAFSNPGVLERWTAGNYFLIYFVICISILGFLLFGTEKILKYIKSKTLLLIFNISFIILFLVNILLHRIAFPLLPDSSPVQTGESNLIAQLVTYLMLILSPIIFINISIFIPIIKTSKSTKLTAPFLIAVITIVVCVLILIFTNVWGYVNPVSQIFRNQFHLPFLIAGIFMLLPYLFITHLTIDTIPVGFPKRNHFISGLLVVLSIISAFYGTSKQPGIYERTKRELMVMTYNIQQGVDFFGNKNYKKQLKLITEINPDILCLQESDGSRISGGNSDIVRYFEENLGYYSYYGPKTVTGTYGTAILSRFPLHQNRTFFTYSSKDEIGTAVSEIDVDGQIITIINSHPAGNDKAREAHAKLVAKLAMENKMVVAPGDYNFRQNSPYYKIISDKLKDSWISLYPDAIGYVETNKLDLTFNNRNSSSGQILPDGRIDMKERIDHIFLSDNFEVVEAQYLPAPESGTDHPAYWAMIRW